jgi:Permuted papain-like amidase enzyme, YaeF/YiiX, C92 family
VAMKESLYFMINWCKHKITDLLVRYLSAKVRNYEPFAVSTPESLESVLQVADIILVEGNQRFSTAVKYLTQSTWSHAAIYVGHADGLDHIIPGTPSIIEADLENGVIAASLSKYAEFNTRICRPVGLDTEDRQKVAQFMVDSIGMKYDLKNVIDLARYLLPMPPVPNRWRRSMLALGSGDPTRVICSTRIAQAFQFVGYPILPRVEQLTERECEKCRETVREILHIRHHSLFTPRDFDVSPYFEIIKPTVKRGFDHKQLNWSDKTTKSPAQDDVSQS